MTVFSWHTLAASNYKEDRLSFIGAAEGFELQAYLDTASIPTIGIGFNLRDPNILKSTLLAIFYPEGGRTDFVGEDANFADEMDNLVFQSYSSAGALNNALNFVMGDRSAYWQSHIQSNPIGINVLKNRNI